MPANTAGRRVRQIRHTTRVHLQAMARDDDAMEDAVLPVGCHDLGRKASPPAGAGTPAGSPGGFKVWKTPFWKRRRQLWAERNARRAPADRRANSTGADGRPAIRAARGRR